MSPNGHLCRLCVESLARFPESYDDLRSVAKTIMTEKEHYALLLTLGQQQCLNRLLNVLRT